MVQGAALGGSAGRLEDSEYHEVNVMFQNLVLIR